MTSVHGPPHQWFDMGDGTCGAAATCRAFIWTKTKTRTSPGLVQGTGVGSAQAMPGGTVTWNSSVQGTVMPPRTSSKVVTHEGNSLQYCFTVYPKKTDQKA